MQEAQGLVSQLSDVKSQIVCSFCRKPGHLIRNCPNPKCKVAKGQSFTKSVATFSMVNSNHLYQPFNTHGSVNVYREVKHPIRIVRDTGGSLSLILKSSVPGIEKCYTGEKIFILDFHGPFAMPLAKIHLDCPLVKGEVIVAVCDHKSCQSLTVTFYFQMTWWVVRFLPLLRFRTLL